MSVPPSSSGPAPALPAFDNTLGALLIGGLVAMALWGITCVQTFTFFTRKSRDRPWFKFMIASLWLLDTFDSVLNGHILYFYLVTNYLNPIAIITPVWSVVIHVAITSISNYIIRTMFALRFYKLSKGNVAVTAWIMAISTTDLVCGIVITAKAFGIVSYLDLDKLSSLMYLDFAAGTASDLSVALALSFLLVTSRTGFRRTDSLINVLMLYTVNTGFIVALDATLGMITYAVMPHNFIFLGFYLLLSKLYLNSYLAALNARDDLRERIDEPVSIHLSQISGPRSRYDPGMSLPVISEKTSRSETMAISVQTLVEKQHDGSATSSPVDFRGQAY
ncbi:hypothetical protein BDZ94DRAFT_1253822 [Collybia nuda]|uniref:DUF6534 domain-containing protein n=1 Tax=Collybia nuda TaxID=64659 RepID=A0A9P6CGM6_9AGAR|nr:hypothetical protein BDZ94DRAFT_1253822 [Collybia nuda]